MKIRSLELTDYRAFAGTHRFRFAEQFAVVAGVNGRGKTTLLEGVALMASRFLRAVGLSEGNQRAIYAQDIHGEAERASLTMELRFGPFPVTFQQRRTRRGSRAGGTRFNAATREALVTEYGLRGRPDDQVPIAVYYTTDRAGFRLPRSVPTRVPLGSRVTYVGALVNRMVDYRDLMARYRVWREEPGHRTLQAFHHALGTFLAGFDNLEVDADRARLTVEKDALALILPQLSDGERSFVAMLADLVRRLALANPRLGNPLLGDGLVLIDELELHLHPTWQRAICDNLRQTFPNLQFIGTTHSPFVIQSLRPGELVDLDPEEFDGAPEYSGKSIEDIAEDVMGVEVPQRSERYLRMMAAAEDYFRTLRDRDATAEVIALAQARLNEAAAPYGDDPAFQALIAAERAANLRGGENAAG